jgi:hypothetical protein
MVSLMFELLSEGVWDFNTLEDSRQSAVAPDLWLTKPFIAGMIGPAMPAERLYVRASDSPSH